MPSSVSPATLSLYPGIWHVQFSSRRLWHGKRNIQANFTASNSLDYTYQEHEELEVKIHKEINWEVAGGGKDGKLESWMTETEAGIVDTSGEIRADWRSRWVAVVFPLNSDPFDGVDILCNRQKRISDETMNEILGVFESKGGNLLKLKQIVLSKVLDDGARNAEIRMADEQRLREWEKRSGEKEGISEDLIYDDVEEEGSRCGVQ